MNKPQRRLLAVSLATCAVVTHLYNVDYTARITHYEHLRGSVYVRARAHQEATRRSVPLLWWTWTHDPGKHRPSAQELAQDDETFRKQQADPDRMWTRYYLTLPSERLLPGDRMRWGLYAKGLTGAPVLLGVWVPLGIVALLLFLALGSRTTQQPADQTDTAPHDIDNDLR